MGWSLASYIWGIARQGNGDIDADPNITGAIQDGLLDADFAATNLALGAGQVRLFLAVQASS